MAEGKGQNKIKKKNLPGKRKSHVECIHTVLITSKTIEDAFGQEHD